LNELLKHSRQFIKVIQKEKVGRYSSPDDGFLVMAGNYTVEIVTIKDGIVQTIVEL
jgi:hypothetical protein